MMLDIIIIEDEPNNLALVKAMLETHADFVRVVGEAGSVDTAVSLLSTTRADIVLMDIRIRGGTGFDVLDRLGKYDFQLIFTTAFAQYAIDAIKKRAFDYLLKPLKSSELEEALLACRERIAEKTGTAADAKIPADKYLVHKSTDGQEMLLFEEILCFKANGAYTEVYLQNQRKMISKNIGELEEVLSPQQFFRVHHSYIINIRYIRRVELKRSGTVELTDATIIPVSQRKKKDFLAYLQNHGLIRQL